jgi:hypothetical protein
VPGRGWHVALVHTLLAQSVVDAQGSPFGRVPPGVVGARQVPSTQRSLAQSVLPEHGPPLGLPSVPGRG